MTKLSLKDIYFYRLVSFTSHLIVMTCSLGCGFINGELEGTFYCFCVTLIQRGNSLWSALYSRASFNQNTTPAVLIKHRRAKVFTDVFYNVDCLPLTRTQCMWAICLILCKVNRRVGSTLKSKSSFSTLTLQLCHLYICCLFFFILLPYSI